MALRRGSRRGVNVSVGLGGLGSLIFPVLVIGGLGYAVYWGVGRMQRYSEADVKKTAAQSPGLKGAHSRPAPVTRPAPPDAELRAALEQAAMEANLAMLRKEAARYAGNTVAVTSRGAAAVNARNAFERLASRSQTPPEVLESDDEILGVDDVALVSLKPDAAATWLEQMTERIAPGSSYRVRVKTAAGEATRYLVFTTGVGSAPASVSGTRVKISSDLALEIQKQVLSLPPDLLSSGERREIERIVGQGEASADEYDMIRRRLQVNATLTVNRDKDRGEFERASRKLEALLLTAPVPEALIMKDGRRFVGALAGETQTTISIRTLVGPITVALEDVKEKIPAKELRDEFKRRFDAGEKFRESYLQLLTWTREWDMPVHREYVAYALLMGDPGDRVARLAAGYFQAPSGEWIPQNSIASGARIPVRKVETKAEAKTELEAMGFTLRGNHWLAKALWEDGIENLHNPGKLKLSLSGAIVMAWHEQDSPKFRLLNPTGKPKDGSPPRLRFIAPTAAQGLATITLEAPGEIVDLQIRAVGGVLDEGPRGVHLETWVTPEGGRSHVLYDIDSGSNQNWHDVSGPLRGKRKFAVTSRMTTVKDTYHAYSRFLYGLPESKDVFGVRGTVLKAAPEIDRIWATLK